MARRHLRPRIMTENYPEAETMEHRVVRMNYGGAMDDFQTTPNLTNEQRQLCQNASSEHPPRNTV